MTFRQWLIFALMACTWGSASHIAVHYTAAALNTYRARQTELWFECQVRRHLQ